MFFKVFWGHSSLFLVRQTPIYIYVFNLDKGLILC